ncbi:MAG: tRNA (adenosine(37)-N6)-threonylcarbamoyltransferase complex dimerization subunit type 1 TsaB [Lachnospiraceae bacterium]|nr:tRNA (adenosine(37)-N6)-threonylcarbamoyltransferase complex dimerization subunit type 1 TsaB [Lachnospiraceae bacterium]
MTIVGIESSALVASVAIIDEERLIAEYTVNNQKTHSQTLLPMLDEIMKALGLAPDSIDAIAVSRGPGSFTGLRIGAATAKGLGLALDKPIVEVPTLAALAWNLFGTGDSLVCPIMDARRAEVYSGVYCFDDNCGEGDGQTAGFRTIIGEQAGPLAGLIDELNKLGRKVIFLGDAVPVYRELIAGNMKVPYSFAPEHLSRQRAGSVAVLGLKLFREGRVTAARDHVPVYLRVSQAERERNA